MHRGHGLELGRADVRKWLEKHPASSLSAGRIESFLRSKWNERWLADHPATRSRSHKRGEWLGNGPPVRRLGSGWTAVTAVLTEDPPAALQSLLPFEGTLFSVMLVESGEQSWIVTGAVDLETLGAVALKLP